MSKHRFLTSWFARISVALVFAVNVNCGLAFILQPENYVAGFEVSGVSGKVIVQGFGILFLMWNATYPLVIFSPWAHRTLFWIILIQQSIGVIGEIWLWLKLPVGHTALAATGQRFIYFDSFGLVLMGLAFGLLMWVNRLKNSP